MFIGVWVPVLEDDNSSKFIPGYYFKEDVYQGEDALPNFDNEEDCQTWCNEWKCVNGINDSYTLEKN